MPCCRWSYRRSTRINGMGTRTFWRNPRNRNSESAHDGFGFPTILCSPDVLGPRESHYFSTNLQHVLIKWMGNKRRQASQIVAMFSRLIERGRHQVMQAQGRCFLRAFITSLYKALATTSNEFASINSVIVPLGTRRLVPWICDLSRPFFHSKLSITPQAKASEVSITNRRRQGDDSPPRSDLPPVHTFWRWILHSHSRSPQ